MSSCFGLCGRQSDDDAREPLLPQYHDDTTMQARLHEKLHTYQMLRGLSQGFMPSTEQLIIQLRTLLAADILNPDDSSLSDSGRLLAKFTKQWLRQFIELIQHKNGEDQIQEFIWLLTHARLSVDTEQLAQRVSKIKSGADTQAAYRSIQTVGSLLLTNSDFRRFLGDLQVVGREVFKDSAMSASRVAEQVGNEVDPQTGPKGIAGRGGRDSKPITQDDLLSDVKDVSSTVKEGAAAVSNDTHQSAKTHLSGPERETLLSRLRATVEGLRQRKDYSEASSTIATLLKRYALTYSRALEDAVEVSQDTVQRNDEVDSALRNFWKFLSSFGERKEWTELKKLVEGFIQKHRSSPDFEKLVNEISNEVQQALTNPEYFSKDGGASTELSKLYENIGNESPVSQEVRGIMNQVQRTYHSVVTDGDVSKMLELTSRIFGILSPMQSNMNSELLQDAINVFAPLLIQAVQYIPIPRLEVSVPEIDLLLENLIIEPGKTVNHTSFLPFRFKAETYNDLEIRKAHTRTVSKVKSLLTIKIDGLSLRADEIGFWLRAHTGLLHLADEGIASFQVDERGVDIHLDVEIGENQLEKVLSLKAVRVHIHKLSYDLSKSRFSFLAWLLKPLLRPIIRKVMEKQLANAIADGIHSANRELVYARERLRATRIADPQDMMTFVKAIMTRLSPPPDPDVYTRVGVAQPGHGVFKGVYAPGSVVKLWNEQAMRAPELIDDFDRGGWKNHIFDVKTTAPA